MNKELRNIILIAAALYVVNLAVDYGKTWSMSNEVVRTVTVPKEEMTDAQIAMFLCERYKHQPNDPWEFYNSVTLYVKPGMYRCRQKHDGGSLDKWSPCQCTFTPESVEQKVQP